MAIFSAEMYFLTSFKYIANCLIESGGNQSNVSQLQTTGPNDQLVGSIASNIAKGLFRYLVFSSNETYYCSYSKLGLKAFECSMHYLL